MCNNSRNSYPDTFLNLPDSIADMIQVFDNAGHYLYHKPTPPDPSGLCLSDELIFVTTNVQAYTVSEHT